VRKRSANRRSDAALLSEQMLLVLLFNRDFNKNGPLGCSSRHQRVGCGDLKSRPRRPAESDWTFSRFA
jgi:hypothetical protein